MKHKNILKFLFVSVLLGLGGGSFSAMADKSDVALIAAMQEDIVNVTLGKAEMIDLNAPVADVLVADPSIVDVMAIKSNRLYVVGASLGDTNIIALDTDGNIVKQIDIHVQMDTRKLDAMIRELYPDEKVKIKTLTDQMLITGEVSTPAVANRIANLAAQYAAEVQQLNAASVDDVITNMLSVRGEQQVMLRVKIVEASRSALKELGLNAALQNGTSGNFNVSGVGGTGGVVTTQSQLGLNNPAQLFALGLNYTTGGFGPLDIIGQALEEDGILNTLAEPNLTAISGEQAGFLAGGEFPIPTQLDQNGNLVYEFRPFGVSLNFRPVVLSSNRISMQLTTEVSSASFDEGLQLQGISVPTFNVRRAETTVELPSGGTLMIAGLLQSESVSGLTKLPGIGDVPVLGDLVKSDSFARNESEIVVIITPYLVEPFAMNNTAPQGLPPVQKYSASAPADTMPSPATPQEKEPRTAEGHKIFERNLRRTFGTVPQNVISQTPSSGFGYILD